MRINPRKTTVLELVQSALLKLNIKSFDFYLNLNGKDVGWRFHGECKSIQLKYFCCRPEDERSVHFLTLKPVLNLYLLLHICLKGYCYCLISRYQRVTNFSIVLQKVFDQCFSANRCKMFSLFYSTSKLSGSYESLDFILNNNTTRLFRRVYLSR